MEGRLKDRIYAVFAGGFLLMIVFAWLGQRIHVGLVSRGIEVRQENSVEATREFIRSEFENIQYAMKQVALEAAGVTMNYTLPLAPTPSPILTQDLENIQIPEQWSLSVYDADRRLIAWQGEEIPSAHNSRWSIARDDEWRTALVLWEPIVLEGRTVGHVCVTQNLFSRVPVRNSILEDYDIVDTWRRHAGLDIQVAYGDTVGEHPLHSLDGQILGTYAVIPSSEVRLITATAAVYSNLMALGAALLIMWCILGIWRWCGRNLNLARFLVLAASLCTGRFVWLYLDVPARYQTGKAPLSPLFDPVHLASTLGSGLLRSTGDVLITSACIFILGVVAFRCVNKNQKVPASRRNVWMYLPASVLAGLIAAILLHQFVDVIVMDSTLRYTGRSILVPSSLELVVYGSMVLLALGGLLMVSAGVSIGFRMNPGRICLSVCAGIAVMGILFLDSIQWCSWILSLSFMAVCLYISLRANKDLYTWLAARRAVPASLGICLLLYPVYYQALEKRKRDRVEYAASTFDQRGSPDVSMAVREVLEEAMQRPTLHTEDGFHLEAKTLLSSSLLSSLGAYDAGITLLSSDGEVIHSIGSTALSPEISTEILTEIRTESEFQGSKYRFIETQRAGIARYQHTGLAAVGDRWILVRAQPHIVAAEANTPLLRILLASGYLDLYEDLSLASYRNGQLVRTFGDRFARYKLAPDIVSDLAGQQSIWRHEGRYLTYYLRRDTGIVAARMTRDGTFDHLYYLLRLVTGGLLLCIPFCAVGYAMQWRTGLIPRVRLRYQDKVMNAFLLLGVVAVIPVGIAGYSVVTEENEKAVQSWLRQHLERVESTLALGGNSITALERSPIDSLSAHVGLDLNLYRGTKLIAASRRQLIEDRIVDVRLPAEVFVAIYGNAERFTFVDHKLGNFEYTAGYRAILDAKGEPVYVLSVPTLPEAERIEEERARTLAYLFGAMLGLGILVMFTGSVLARALAQPIARLQQGLEEAAQGKFERVLPVESRDEIGALVKTFNTMQGQLFESRQKLASQQRKLAWREMARQIAHEIKNPLTPMKLSIQHLQHSFENKNQSGFKRQFERTTSTLVAQIDSLAHIANEFSSFARLPSRDVVDLDVRSVIRDAYVLMQAEASSDVALDLHLPDTPLPVRGDPGELRRTYINLIKNALEAVGDRKNRRITIVARLIGEQILTEVTDNGRGIPREMQERIFEPNFSTKTSGAGLGLAIARQAVELSGGQISFTTEHGKGTTMRVTLPLRQTSMDHSPEKSRKPK